MRKHRRDWHGFMVAFFIIMVLAITVKESRLPWWMCMTAVGLMTGSVFTVMVLWARRKERLEELNNMHPFAKGLKLVNYDFYEDRNQKHVGFIAQDVEARDFEVALPKE